VGVADANLVPRNSEDVYFAEKKDARKKGSGMVERIQGAEEGRR
jgi:hypothetical protein